MTSEKETKRQKLTRSSFDNSMSARNVSHHPSTPKSWGFNSSIDLPPPSIPILSGLSNQTLRSPRKSLKRQALSPLLLPRIQQSECDDEDDCLWSRDNIDRLEFDSDTCLRKRHTPHFAHALKPKFSRSTILDLSTENGVFLAEEPDCEHHDDNIFGTIRVEGNVDGLPVDSPGYLLHLHSLIESDGSFFNERLW